jgi:hypothetical protein
VTMQVVAIYRSASYSPGRHRSNDSAIMDATTDRLAANGITVERLGEGDVEAGIVPAAELYLNMCQGAAASRQLLDIEAAGIPIINRASSVLGCHRHRLIATMQQAAIPFPATALMGTAAGPHPEWSTASDLWVKRGDVHAQEAADVVRTTGDQVGAVLAAFHTRGVQRVAIQQHVEGPVLKFYGVGDGSLFHAFREDGRPVDGDTVDLRVLRAVAVRAARAVGLQVFGGDAVVPHRTAPVLVDLNDWPSFAPIRDLAADAIAAVAMSALVQRSIR